ncbi:DUF1853 family protein [bacterium SCSIO 12741]|nr:DUF1853 family protein [bacterium SCSIO 12741]
MFHTLLPSKVARDFFWMLESSSLLQGDSLILEDKFLQDSAKRMEAIWSSNPQELEKDLASLEQNAPPRLGFYFERLMAIWLKHDPMVQLKASGLQVKSGKTTLGEFDFIVYNQLSGRDEHWEVAVKFYLLFQPDEGLNGWKGTFPKDTLEEKLVKMRGRQLKLGETPEGLRALHQIGLHEVSPKMLLKGMLFYPLHYNWKSTPQFPEINPYHQKGWWSYMDRFDHGGRNRYWLPIQKKDWFSPQEATDEDIWDGVELKQNYLDEYASSSLSFMIAEMNYSSGKWQEVSRGFVVGNRWPNDYQAS